MKEKLEDTEKCVQEFINEMGTMIDVAEKDPELGLYHMSDANLEFQNDGTNARSGTGGGSVL